jgi:glycosyltransferase involved in cell wall biosynthesis
MRDTAVIATATGGSTEIVRDRGTGYLIDPSDVSSLSDRLAKVLSDRNLAEEMGANGREVAMTEFTSDQMVDRFLNLYSRLAPEVHNSPRDIR